MKKRLDICDTSSSVYRSVLNLNIGIMNGPEMLMIMINEAEVNEKQSPIVGIQKRITIYFWPEIICSDAEI